MAITFQKQPLNFFNVSEPAIFEFTSDADLGVNQNDLVADLELKSLWTGRRYVIRGIQPKYGTGDYRVDVQGYLKSLMLDNFEYRFENPNKQYSIEAFEIGVAVHPENVTDPTGDAYVFDSGYIFDESFVFAETVPNDTTETVGFYPQLGQTQISEDPRPQKDPLLFNMLAPKYVEFAEGFTQTLSIFVARLDPSPRNVIVDGVTTAIPNITGVATAPISDAQVRKMYLPTLLTTSLNNPAITVYGLSYKGEDCENTLQFRFYTSYAGYCYFYTPREARTAGRTKSESINNAFYNQQDGRSQEVQRSVSYTEELNLSGTKRLELQELFRELLRSPKIEILLPRGFTECKVKGQMNVRKLDFEYSLTVDIANVEQMSL